MISSYNLKIVSPILGKENRNASIFCHLLGHFFFLEKELKIFKTPANQICWCLTLDFIGQHSDKGIQQQMLKTRAQVLWLAGTFDFQQHSDVTF